MDTEDSLGPSRKSWAVQGWVRTRIWEMEGTISGPSLPRGSLRGKGRVGSGQERLRRWGPHPSMSSSSVSLALWGVLMLSPLPTTATSHFT